MIPCQLLRVQEAFDAQEHSAFECFSDLGFNACQHHQNPSGWRTFKESKQLFAGDHFTCTPEAYRRFMLLQSYKATDYPSSSGAEDLHRSIKKESYCAFYCAAQTAG